MPTSSQQRSAGGQPIGEADRPQLAPHARVTFDAARQRHILLGPESVSILNTTGAAIVDLCDGHRTVAEIIAELNREYHHVAGDQVWSFLCQLAARRWMEVCRG